MSKQLFLAEEEFNRLLKNEMQFTADFVRKTKPTCLPPRLVVVVKEGESQPHKVVVFEPDIPDDSEAKNHIFQKLGRKFYSTHKLCPLAAFLSVEAWISKQMETMPSRDPQRQEAVVISGRSMDGRDAMAVAPVFRDTGEIIRLGKFNQHFHATTNLLLKAFFDAFLQTAFGDLKGKGRI